MKSYETDTLMFDVHAQLCHDMHRSLGIVGQSSCRTAASQKDIAEIRKTQLLLHENLTVPQFKWAAQVNSFLKRYTFQNEPITPTQREELTNEKFIQLQINLAQVYWKPRSLRCHKTLCRARSIVRRVLGGFEPQGDDPRGMFGTKATVGCPASKAYIDVKLMERPITGSVGHLEWFKNGPLANDPLLASIIERNPQGFQSVSSLAQVNVPKKFSIDRGINPNTLIGSSYSAALGHIITDALTQEGLNIKKLQHIHGIRAQQASTHGRWATADLSDASHGYLSHLLNALLPRKWYRAVMRGVIRQVEVAGVVSRLESIMTMGIGFTFPMQTLLFYCLLKALAELSGVRGLISVYGDDLIYPVKLHRFVTALFSDLGFKLNLDKTYVHSHFKESCGSDFFKGEAVRPFSPEGQSESLGKSQYAAFCYKLLNGLLRRWSLHEISGTVHLLCSEITSLYGELFVVPKEWPDHSGLKLASSEYSYDVVWFSAYRIAPWVWDSSVFAYKFSYIKSTTRRRFVAQFDPYYWDTLRRMSHNVTCPVGTPLKRHIRRIALDFLRELPEAEPIFKWKTGKDRKYTVSQSGKMLRRKYATVADKEQVTRYEYVSAKAQIHADGMYPT